MGVRSTNPTQSFSSDFHRSGTDAASQSHPGGPVVATGGEQFGIPLAAAPVPNGGGYVYHFFTDTSTPATFQATYGENVNVLVIGGGGAGGYGGGGGGGIAQAVNVPTELPLSGGGGTFTATISVGAGGGTPSPPTTGDNSTFVFAPLSDPSTPKELS